MLDVANLEKYVIVQTGATDPADVADLRELEGNYGDGVYALWTDKDETIIAFAFEPSKYTQEQAAGWVKDIQEPRTTMVRDFIKNLKAMVATFSLSGIEADPKPTDPVSARSHDDTHRLVEVALEQLYTIPAGTDDYDYAKVPWIMDMGDTQAIVRLNGERYVVDYSIDIVGTVTLGSLVKVEKEWIRPDGTPVMLHMFATKLGPGDEAEDEAGVDDSLIWKEIIHPGQWYKSLSGAMVEVTKEIIEAAFLAWEAGVPKYISVPADDHHEWTNGMVPVESNKGFVDKLKLVGDKLFGGFKITDPAIASGVAVGNIADVSVSLIPNVVHPDTGVKYDWILNHVLLTNDPLVGDLEPFGALPVGASNVAGSGFVVVNYAGNTEEDQMPDKKKDGITLSADEQAVLALNLSASEIQAMVTERDSVREQSRALEITRVVRAMEGLEAHDGVTRSEGFRHYPVVCTAVQKAMEECPITLSLSTTEGVQALDTVILGIVNAIPTEGQMAFKTADAAPAGNPDPDAGDPSLGDGEQAEVTDEQIDELSQRIS